MPTFVKIEASARSRWTSRSPIVPHSAAACTGCAATWSARRLFISAARIRPARTHADRLPFQNDRSCRPLVAGLQIADHLPVDPALCIQTGAFASFLGLDRAALPPRAAKVPYRRPPLSEIVVKEAKRLVAQIKLRLSRQRVIDWR